MFSLKRIATVFLIGFLLSFVSGLLGGVSFLMLLLRALISGIVFSVLYFFAYTIYNKFLLSQDAVEIQGEPNVSENMPNSVDIIVEDELPDSATAPTFNLSEFVSPPVVEPQSVMEPLNSSIPIENNQEAVGFQASPLDSITTNEGNLASVEELPDIGDTGSNTDTESSMVTDNRTSFSSFVEDDSTENDDSELGELPDMDSLGVDEDDESLGSSDDLIQDSVFAETGATRPSSEPVAVSELGDAKDIAAAIRTAMVKDT